MPSISGSSARRGAGASMSLQQAATLVESSYKKSKNFSSLSPSIEATLDDDDVQAYLLKDGTLLIPGSNGFWDYLKFNLRPFRIGGKNYSFKDQATGKEIGRFWHQGFLTHAEAIRNKFDAKRPKRIVGHSLGAASAQVLSMVWDIPAICFAPPRVYAGGDPVQHDDKCLCIVLEDDPIRKIPNESFQYIGDVRPLGKNRFFSFKHGMRHYKSAVVNPNFKNKLPDVWPN